MITPETRAEIRRYFYAEHWKIGTIARELSVHPDAVRHAIESDRFHRGPALHPTILDPYLEFVRQTLAQHPRLRATRIYQMIRDRGYTGSIIQLRRTVAKLRPPVREAFLRLQTFPADHYGESGVMLRTASPVASFSAGQHLLLASNFPERRPSKISESLPQFQSRKGIHDVFELVLR